MADKRNWVLRKGLGLGVEFIDKLIAADPQSAVAVLEEGANVDAPETDGISRIVSEDFEGIAVVSVQPILRAKPHEALIVLYDLAHFGLRQPVGSGYTCEPDVHPIDDGRRDWPGINYSDMIARRKLRACVPCSQHQKDD